MPSLQRLESRSKTRTGAGRGRGIRTHQFRRAAWGGQACRAWRHIRSAPRTPLSNPSDSAVRCHSGSRATAAHRPPRVASARAHNTRSRDQSTPEGGTRGGGCWHAAADKLEAADRCAARPCTLSNAVPTSLWNGMKASNARQSKGVGTLSASAKACRLLFSAANLGWICFKS